MKITTQSGKVLYDKPGQVAEEFVVPDDFGELLLAGGVRYMWGEEKDGVISTLIKTLSIDQPDFEKMFRGIAYSEIGKAVFRGELPASTIL